MNLKADRGVIRNLNIVSTKQNILYSPRMQESASTSALIFGITGMGAAAVQTAGNSDSGFDDVDIYRFELNGVRYSGVTRKATFKNGNEIDLVYEEREQGREVFGIRRTATRSMWLYPYMACGSVAAVFRGIGQWFKWGLALTMLMLLIASASNLVNGRGLISAYEFAFICVGIFAIPLIGVSWVLPRLFRFAKAADEVFAAMGFENPKRVNLYKTSKAYRKKHGIEWSMDNYAEIWY